MDTPTPTRSTPKDVIILRALVGFVVGAAVMLAGWIGYTYAFSPAAIRHPIQAHYHFRLQVLNNGTPVNFADSQYQTEFDKDMCTADLTKEPFHFHDGLDQFVHVHWDHLTGGLLLKHYGWNFVGGADDTLGYQFNGFRIPQRVATHGKALPSPSRDAKYYIYAGNADSYSAKSWDDFLHRDLEDFFGVKADTDEHGSVSHSEDPKLARINHVLGSVVIFVQADKPTDQQVKDRFSKLIPLPESSCSG